MYILGMPMLLRIMDFECIFVITDFSKNWNGQTKHFSKNHKYTK